MKRIAYLIPFFATLPLFTAACATEDGETDSSEDALAQGREACAFKRGALPRDTITVSRGGPHIPQGTVDKIVVLMQENRSLDHYFSQLNKYAGRKQGDKNYVDVKEPMAQPEQPLMSPGKQGPLHYGQHAPHLCHADTNHEWYGAHTQYNDGKMNGFWATNQDETELGLKNKLLSGDRALWWYDQRDIPFYYSLAATFGIGDRYFSSLLGPTFPNRNFLYGATTKGIINNYGISIKGIDGDYPFHGKAEKGNPETIFDMLEERGISWKIYSNGKKFGIHVPSIAGVGASVGPKGVAERWGAKSITHFREMDNFYEDSKEGKLPEVTFVDPNLTGGEPISNDEHPPGNIQKGEQFVAKVVNSLMTGKDWKRLALFITYDENGGIYDHVTPPKACEPDEFLPKAAKGTEDVEYNKEHPGLRFDRYGFRVPVIVVSAWSKPKHVSHNVYDHTSILRFIETRFGLPALTKRDANADAMLDFFDFSKPNFATPPSLSKAGDNKAEEKYCEDTFGDDSLLDKVKDKIPFI